MIKILLFLVQTILGLVKIVAWPNDHLNIVLDQKYISVLTVLIMVPVMHSNSKHFKF